VENAFDNRTQFAVLARGHVIATRNYKPTLAAPTLLRKSVEAHWRPLDAPDRARAYSEQMPYVYRIDGGRSRNLNEHTVTPTPSTRLSAGPHGGSEQRRRTKAVLFSYPARRRSAASHPFNRTLGPGILGGKRAHKKISMAKTKRELRHAWGLSDSLRNPGEAMFGEPSLELSLANY